MIEVSGKSRIAAVVVTALALALALSAIAVAQTTETTAETTETTETTVETTETTAETTETTGGEGEAAGDTISPDAGPNSVVTPAPEDLALLNPDLNLEQLVVQVWPEYDSQDLLVMSDLRLPADVTFPVEMQIPIPRGARLTGVAEVRSDGSFDYSRPAPTPNLEAGTPEWDVYNITIPKLRDVRVEYYHDPGVTPTGPRDYPVVYRVPMDAASSSLTIQQPLRAAEFAIDPPLSQSTTDAEGFTYFSESLGAMEANQLMSVDVSYTKPDAEPSVGATVDETGASSSSLILWLIAILAIGVLGFVAYRLFLRPASAPASGSGRAGRRKKPEASRVSAQKSGGTSRFCTQCGTKLNKRDRFCPECGQERV